MNQEKIGGGCIKCECGIICLKKNIKKHQQSKKHFKNIEFNDPKWDLTNGKITYIKNNNTKQIFVLEQQEDDSSKCIDIINL
jgi:hypothetical protein